MRFEDVELEGHLGQTLGYNSAALRDPETGALFVMTSNDDRAAAGLMAARIAHLVRSW